jgi:hypothetical protein
MISAEKSWALQQLLYAEVLRRLDTLFTELSIKYMPIKGAYLIARGLAAAMPSRKMADIDILLLPMNFAQASDYFRHLDCVRVSENYWPFETSFFFRLGSNNAYVELHSQLNFPQRFLLPATDLFARALPAGGQRVLPSAEDALLILICHALVHIAVEFRETVFPEISCLCGQEDFSWERFWKLAEGTGIKGFIGCVLSRYAQETGAHMIVPEVSAASAYSKFSGLLLKREVYGAMPALLRKLLLEIPFVRDPLWLIWHKAVRNAGRTGYRPSDTKNR